VYYEATSGHDGKVIFVVSFVRPVFNWEIRSLGVGISAQRPGAGERILEIGRKIMPPVQPPPKNAAPNPSFNTDPSPAGLELLGLRQWRRRAG
jgi:hypothetical protein